MQRVRNRTYDQENVLFQLQYVKEKLKNPRRQPDGAKKNKSHIKKKRVHESAPPPVSKVSG